MRRIIPILAVSLLACQTLFQPQQNFTSTPIATSIPTASETSSLTPTSTPDPTATSKPPEKSPYTVRIHPDDGLYVGDLVSFEVVAPAGYEDHQIQIQVFPPNGPVFGPQPFHVYGLGDEALAEFRWVWDTSDLDATDITIYYKILDGGPSWEQVVTLYPEDSLPPDALEAIWERATSGCCLIYYLSGTSAQRDLQLVIQEVDLQAGNVVEVMGVDFSSTPVVVLLPRVIGHGGFATDEIYISYLDRNYAGSSLGQVLSHELIHILDRHAGGQFRPTMLVEGLAVYYSGGHFKPEPLFERAATLLELNWYIPIPTLADDFYLQQHEIGYLEAGALIEYMVDKWGEEAFDNFYRDIDPPEDSLHSTSIDAALQNHFGVTLAELDAQFYTALQNSYRDPVLKSDVQTTVYFYDTVRRYQQSLDPSAYFLTAWFLEIEDLLDMRVTADYQRHPGDTENIILEAMLVTADAHLRAGEYFRSQSLLDSVNVVLDGFTLGRPDPFGADYLANNYFAIVEMLIMNGYQPQQISLNTNSARALVLAAGPELIELDLEFKYSAWYIVISD